jgi:hypothetical protein
LKKSGSLSALTATALKTVIWTPEQDANVGVEGLLRHLWGESVKRQIGGYSVF